MSEENNKAEELKKKSDRYGNTLAGNPLKSTIKSSDEEE